MKIGDLVRVKQSQDTCFGRDWIGVVINNGTWSVDVYIIGAKTNWRPRIAKEKLEVIV